MVKGMSEGALDSGLAGYIVRVPVRTAFVEWMARRIARTGG